MARAVTAGFVGSGDRGGVAEDGSLGVGRRGWRFTWNIRAARGVPRVGD
jgi:hypothetical protein